MKSSDILTARRSILKKARHIGNASKIWLNARGKPDKPYRYIFHHLPKCGGTSAFDALSNWFICIKDYPSPWGNINNPNKYERFCNTPRNPEKLRHYHR